MSWNGKIKSDKDRRREKIETEIGKLQFSVREREAKILSRAFIRDADLNEMKREKDQLRSDDSQLQILKRRLARMEEGALK